MPRRMSYRKMFLFMLPLAAVFAAGDIGQQVLNGGMARMPDAIATLAAYGLALGIKGLLSTPLIQAGQLGIGLTESHAGRLQIQRFLLVVASCIGLLLAGLGLTPIGVWLTRDLHSLTNPLGAEVQFALLCMVPLVFVDGWARYYSGLLLRYQHSGWTSAGTSARIGASIVTVFSAPAPGLGPQPPHLAPHPGNLRGRPGRNGSRPEGIFQRRPPPSARTFSKPANHEADF